MSAKLEKRLLAVEAQVAPEQDVTRLSDAELAALVAVDLLQRVGRAGYADRMPDMRVAHLFTEEEWQELCAAAAAEAREDPRPLTLTPHDLATLTDPNESLFTKDVASYGQGYGEVIDRLVAEGVPEALLPHFVARRQRMDAAAARAEAEPPPETPSFAHSDARAGAAEAAAVDTPAPESPLVAAAPESPGNGRTAAPESGASPPARGEGAGEERPPRYLPWAVGRATRWLFGGSE